MRENRIKADPLAAIVSLANSLDLLIKVKTGWRVAVVCASRGTREIDDRIMDEAEAKEIADWFGRDDDLYAEIVPHQSVTIDLGSSGKAGAA